MKKLFVIVLAVFLCDLSILLLDAAEIVKDPMVRDTLTKYAMVGEFDSEGKLVKGNK